jgi:hypothetical protein
MKTAHKLCAKKQNCTIRINAQILTQAKAAGINISKTAENALKQKLTPNNTFFGTAFFQKKVFWCGRRDLNPSTRLGKPGS